MDSVWPHTRPGQFLRRENAFVKNVMGGSKGEFVVRYWAHNPSLSSEMQ